MIALLDLIEAPHELARLHVERSGEAHDDRDGRVAAAGFDLGQVRDADPGALGADRLREAAAVPQLAHPEAERAAEPLVQIVGWHGPASYGRAAGRRVSTHDTGGRHDADHR